MYHLSRSFILLSVLIALSGFAQAQRENTNWLFGKGLGLTFGGGAGSGIPAPAHASQRYITSTACISDKKTGQLLFYTNGMDVFTRNHQAMPNALTTSFYADHVLIVPDPGDSMQYYILYTYSTSIYYAKVDLRLNGGLGNVAFTSRLLIANADNKFAVVKQLYNAGYWLITHVPNTTTFKTYRITPEGIETTPVISSTNENVLWPVAQTFYSEIVTTITGTQLAVMNNDGSSPNGKFILLYDFDKKCGTVTLHKQLHAPYFIYDIAYDAQAKFLYVVAAIQGGDKHIMQYDLNANNQPLDTLPGSDVASGSEPMRHLKLGPDNRIYITKEEMIENGYSPSRYLDVINNPSVQGSGINYVEHAFNLSPGNKCFNDPCFLTDRFPNMMMDRTIQQPLNFEEPQISIANFCFGDVTTFAQTHANLYADSVQWDFGDTTYANVNVTSHKYLRVGTYAVSFNWYLCGLKYALHQKVVIGAIPVILLGNDSTICNGHQIKLHPADSAESYVWSTGDTSFQITVYQPGTFSVKVRNGQCESEEAINISYYPPLWTSLGDEYFICDRDKELVKLDAGPGYVQYKWTPTGDTSQWIIVGDLGNYFVVVTDFRGCDGNDGTFVKRICPVELFFPTVFTPNDDGLNDTYLPIGNSVITFNIKIYNRWGEKVYEGNDVEKGWDGKEKGLFAPADVYVYTAEYSGYIHKILTPFYVKGNITLLR